MKNSLLRNQRHTFLQDSLKNFIEETFDESAKNHVNLEELHKVPTCKKIYKNS